MAEQRGEGSSACPAPARPGRSSSPREPLLQPLRAGFHLRGCPGMLRPDAQVAAPWAALGPCQDTKNWCRVTTNAQQQHCRRAGAEPELLLPSQAAGPQSGVNARRDKLRMNGHLSQIWQQKSFASFSGFCINSLPSAPPEAHFPGCLNRSVRVGKPRGRCRTPALEPSIPGIVHVGGDATIPVLLAQVAASYR